MFGDNPDKEVPLRQHSNLSSPLHHRLRAGFARLRNENWPVLQTGVAASAAWYLATLLLENSRPFFATGYDPGELAEIAQHMMRKGGQEEDKSLIDRVREKL